MAELPTKDDLKELPLRAIVAYAVRCARRVQPFLRLAQPIPRFTDHQTAVEDAILLAECFCLGQDLAVARASTAADDAAAAADAVAVAARAVYVVADPAKAAAAARATYAVKAAAAAAHAAAFAARLVYIGADPGKAVHAAFAAADAAVAATGAGGADDAPKANAAKAAFRGDFDRLLELNLGTFPEFGQPIDSTDVGPLGPLGRFWPEDREFEAFGDLAPDLAESAPIETPSAMLRKRIDKVLNTLSYQEREIIRQRYRDLDRFLVESGYSDSGDINPPLEVYIDPGDASKETIQEVLEALCDLHREAGGLGLEFSVDGLFVMAREEVTV